MYSYLRKQTQRKALSLFKDKVSSIKLYLCHQQNTNSQLKCAFKTVMIAKLMAPEKDPDLFRMLLWGKKKDLNGQ